MSTTHSSHRDVALRQLLQCLDGVAVWVDSGTLLALHRDGKILDWDGDIDLSCWESEVSAILSRRTQLEHLGYRVAIRSVAGQSYKIKLTPPLRERRKGALHVDISIYRRRADWAISPGIYRYRPGTPVWKFPNIVGHSVRELLLICWLAVGARRNVSLRRPRIAMRLFTWCVPADIFTSFEELDVGDVTSLRPEDVDRYLSYRYGDWATPQREWSYFHDDRSVLDVRPEKTLLGEGLPASVRSWESRPHG